MLGRHQYAPARNRADPLGGLRLTADDFAWVGAAIAAQARRLCQGRVVSCLEGGYNPAALAVSVVAYCQGTMQAL